MKTTMQDFEIQYFVIQDFDIQKNVIQDFDTRDFEPSGF